MAKTWKKNVAGCMAALMMLTGLPLSDSMAVQAVDFSSPMNAKTVSGNDVSGEKVYTFDDLLAKIAWSDTQVTDPTFTFAKQYQEIWLDLPEPISADDCEKLTISLSDQQGTVAFKLYNSSNEDLGTFYGQNGKTEYSIMPTGSGDITRIGVMENDNDRAESGDYPFSVTFESITVKVAEGSAPQNTSLTYGFGDVEIRERWNASNVMSDATLTFTGEYQEFYVALPEPIPAGTCVKAQVAMTGTTGAIALKLYGADYADMGVSYRTDNVAPTTEDAVYGLGIMSLDAPEEGTESYSITFESVTFTLTSASGGEDDPIVVPFGVNLIQNPNFADADVSVWGAEKGDATIECRVADAPVFDEVTTYGAIVGERSNYNCFAQDVTAVMEKNQEYQFEFYAMLDAEDYADAPETQRVVQFAPFIVANGETNYGPKTAGTTSQVLTPGKWTKYSGTFTPTWVGKKADKIVIRLLEQGENYGQGDGVKGTFYVTGVSLMKVEKEPVHIQEDIPDWKSAITEALGADVIAGTAMTQNEFSDEALVALVQKHFNGVTFGNELKPDSVFGYSNTTCPGTETVILNGEELVVPKTNFSRGDAMADAIKTWNEENPDLAIKIRGHVLVWHSQTPEWFFHEGYDAANPYVSEEEMTKRQEWYIKTVLEHYVGAESPYKDLFYGWDVVNEAISDGTNTYRTDKENPGETINNGTRGSNSSWWAVYESNEFIINAFRFANKYAPASLELYYNDYNEHVPGKSEGIAKLLQAVKDAEGTRIDGMGMQAHYSVDGFKVSEFLDAARKYAAIVGNIQLTELDFKASASFDGSDAAKEKEYQKIANCHKQLFDALKTLKSEGVHVGAVIVWGVIEPNSWLHSQAGVGGGSDGKSRQCPLLFDGNYQAKPAYWAYVDASQLNPVIKNITVNGSEDGTVEGNAYSFSNEDTAVNFLPVWNAEGLKVRVTVKDSTQNDTDKVTVFVDPANSASDITPVMSTKTRGEGTAVEGGYQVDIDVPVSGLAIGKKIGFDITVTDDAEVISFNDTKNTQLTSSKFYAVATMKPAVKKIPRGTVEIDGKKDAMWHHAAKLPLTIALGSDAGAEASVLWDENYLYVYAEVKDSVLNADSENDYEKDSLEVFIDENNHKTEAYEEDDKQYRINYLNEHSFNGQKCVEENVISAVTIAEDGYVVEAAYKWTDIAPLAGAKIGLELQINDANESGKRVGTLSWYDDTGMGWSSTAVYGTVMLDSKTHEHEAATEWCSDETYHWHECTSGDGYAMDQASHTWDKGTVTTAPTCVDKGVRTYKCTVCGKEKEEEIPATGKHDYAIKTIKATTKADGKIIKTCRDCGKQKTTRIYKIKSVKLSKTEYTYKGSYIKPAIKVTDRKGNVLKEGTDYKVFYHNNKYPGKANVTVRFTGKYSGVVKKTFKIFPKATTVAPTAKIKSFDYKIAKVSKASGYQIQYSTSAKFTEGTTHTKTIKGCENVKGTVKNLKSGVRYYVRVRSYQTVGNAKYCSKWSRRVSVKVK